MLRELESHPVYDDFTDRTLERYRPLVGEIRKHFEALRGEDKILKRQPVGDDIDLDALVTALADIQTGVEITDRLYTQMRKQERDLAVLFMVDVSGSTKGWINDAVGIDLSEDKRIVFERHSAKERNRTESLEDRVSRLESQVDRLLKVGYVVG